MGFSRRLQRMAAVFGSTLLTIALLSTFHAQPAETQRGGTTTDRFFFAEHAMSSFDTICRGFKPPGSPIVVPGSGATWPSLRNDPAAVEVVINEPGQKVPMDFTLMNGECYPGASVPSIPSTSRVYEMRYTHPQTRKVVRQFFDDKTVTVGTPPANGRQEFTWRSIQIGSIDTTGMKSGDQVVVIVKQKAFRHANSIIPDGARCIPPNLDVFPEPISGLAEIDKCEFTSPAVTIYIKTFFNYDPDTTIASDTKAPDGSNRYYPGKTFTVSGKITNVGGTTGSRYDETIRLTKGAQYVEWVSGGSRQGKNAKWNGLGGLGSGRSRTQAAKYRLVDDVPHGTEICFVTDVTPDRGTSGSSGVGTDTSNPPTCFNAYNLQFNFTEPTITNPADIVPGQTLDITASTCNSDRVNRAADGRPHNAGARPGEANRATLTITHSFTGRSDNRDSEVFNDVARRDCPGFTSTYTIPTNVSPGDQYCVTATVSFHRGFSDGTDANGTESSSRECATIKETPFMTITNNGAWVGGGFADQPDHLTCSNVNTAASAEGILATGNVGSYSQFALAVLGNINDFGSNNSATSDVLKFSNTTTPPGQFGASGRCLPNFIEHLNFDHPSPRTNTTITNTMINDTTSPWANQQQFKLDPSGGTVTMSDIQPINPGTKKTFIIDGTLEINSDITYNPNYGSVDQIPSLTFIARDILIQDNVTRLDGLYIAQANFNSCHNAPSSLTINNTCDNPLTIRGMLIAANTTWRRVAGGAIRNPNQPAENIQFAPELYLSPPLLNSSPNPAANTPIRKTIDLPAVF